MKNILEARLTKVDETTGQFWGIAAAEIPDQKGEICDYAASKPFIKAWSDDISEHSGGKSLGNLRAQHNSKVAVGRILNIAFNDEARQVEVHGEVVDSVELEKLAKGLYTGLSFGGDYGKKWRDADGYLRYEAKPIELSLADRPASAATRFTLVKVDGSEVEMEFQKAAEAKVEGPQAGTPAPLGAPAPMEKVGAAISAKNKDHAQQIHDHAAALGATCGGENMTKLAEAETLAKVERLTADITAKDEALAKVAGEKDVALAQVAEKDEELAKVVAEKDAALAQVTEKDDALAKVAGEKAALQTEVDELKKQPAPAKGALREGLHAPSKEEDGLEKAAVAKEPETPLEAVKLAHQKPFFITGR
jgi:hypothetical protein